MRPDPDKLSFFISVAVPAAREACICMIKSEHTAREQRHDQHRQKVLGKKLNCLYAQIVGEAVPGEYLYLLEQAQHRLKT